MALRPGVTDEGQIDRGIAACTDMMKRDGERASVLAGRAELYAKKGKVQDALNDYSSAIEKDPGNYLYYQYRGIFYAQKMHKLDKAVEDFDRVVKLQPQLAEAYYNRGVARAMSGQMQDAEADFTKTLELDPGHEGARRMLR